MKVTKSQPRAQEATKDRGFGAYLYAKYLVNFWAMMGKLGIHKETCNRSGLLVDVVERQYPRLVGIVESVGCEVEIVHNDTMLDFESKVHTPAYWKELCEIVKVLQAKPKMAKDIMALVVKAGQNVKLEEVAKPTS